MLLDFVLFHQNLTGNAWILEIQRHPSLLPSSPFDQRVKVGVVEAVHALLASGSLAEHGALPTDWMRCSIDGVGSEPSRGAVAEAEAAREVTHATARAAAAVDAMGAPELAQWRSRAAFVAREAALEAYDAACHRKELFF